MKHLLNNMSESEKRAIREQHEGGMRIDTSRFRSLLESTVGNVKPLIMEEDPPQVAPPKQNPPKVAPPSNPKQPDDPWIKVIAFSDPETTEAMTNIEIDPHMIGLEGNDVKFTYKVAGKTGNGTGIFNCNSKNEMHFDGKPLTGTMYISDKRVDTLKSKCGANQGYASTGGGSNQNMAESKRTHKRLIKEDQERFELSMIQDKEGKKGTWRVENGSLILNDGSDLEMVVVNA